MRTPAVSNHLTPLIGATTEWLVRTYPACGGVFGATMAAMQAQQAVTVAAWLRYPTAVDAALVEMTGSGGSARLDLLVDRCPTPDAEPEPWRSWVDETVASWAACLLGDQALALSAVAALGSSEHAAGLAYDFRRLTRPDQRDYQVAALLRHPQLVQPVADLYRVSLHELPGAVVRPAA